MASTANQFLTLPTASNINFGASGAADSLDTGSIASGTWYAVYAIAGPASTAAHGLASTSFTTPLMPSGYTYKARIGALVTSTSTASAQLMGIWQLGRQAAYVLGLAQTTVLPIVCSGSQGTYSTTTPSWQTVSVSARVPTTASKINITAAAAWKNNTGANMAVAPNANYGGRIDSNGNPAPIILEIANNVDQLSGTIFLEGPNIAVAAVNAGAAVLCNGWEDNL